jgi:hypothetical protein
MIDTQKEAVLSWQSTTKSVKWFLACSSGPHILSFDPANSALPLNFFLARNKQTWYFRVAILSCNALCERVRGAQDDIEQRSFLPVEDVARSGCANHPTFCLRVERSFRIFFADPLTHTSIDERAKWLHDIGGKAKGIVAVLMPQSNRGMQASGTECSGDRRSQHRIAIVEMTVLVGLVRATPELTIAKDEAPILASCLRFKIALIAGTNSRSHRNQSVIVAVDFSQKLSLGLDLCADDLLPEPLAGRECHLHLLRKPLCLDEMALHGKQHRGGQKVAVDGDDGTASLSNTRENSLRQASFGRSITS